MLSKFFLYFTSVQVTFFHLYLIFSFFYWIVLLDSLYFTFIICLSFDVVIPGYLQGIGSRTSDITVPGFEVPWWALRVYLHRTHRYKRVNCIWFLLLTTQGLELTLIMSLLYVAKDSSKGIKYKSKHCTNWGKLRESISMKDLTT